VVRLLVVNAGSSSLKLRLLGDDDQVIRAADQGTDDADDAGRALASFLDGGPEPEAVGHRVVHGGAEFTGATLLDPERDDRLEALAALAPLHNPPAVAAIRLTQALLPSVPQVACFDTTFHADMPPEAATYALPREWRDRWGLRRYGFHGLSHAWASRRGAHLLGRSVDELRLVTAHIGAGVSLAAVAFGRSVDTTMGFTPLEGVVMATRSGSVDPGLVLWLESVAGLDAERIQQALERESGLLGLSELSADLRDVIQARDDGNERAALAYGVYVHRLRAAVAAMAAAMGGIDGLVFTGGAGERSPRLRADVADGLVFLGVVLDAHKNGGVQTDDEIVSAAGPTAVMVVHAREDLEIAREVRELLDAT